MRWTRCGGEACFDMQMILSSIRLIGYRDAIMNIVVGLVCGFLCGGWVLFR
jgi:hypothetical protein